MDFSHKHDVATLLGSAIDGGVVVEIGCGDGRCTRAISSGMSTHRTLPIYAMDDYEGRPEVKAAFLERVDDITHRIMLVDLQESEVEEWSEGMPIALLWIDWPGDTNHAQGIFGFWERYLIADGCVGIVGGGEELVDYAEGLGYERILADQDHALVLRKRPPRRAAFYIASSRVGYCQEADRSAGSVVENMGIDTVLFLTEDVEFEPQNIGEVHRLPPRSHEFWYLDSTRYFNMALRELAEYDQLLYMDTDTYVCCPQARDIFLLLDRFDLAIGHSPQRDAIDTATGTPASFSTMSIGVNAFRNNDLMRAFFAEWLERYERHAALYDDNDQAPLRDTLYENRLGIRWVTLAPEFTLRFDFGAWVVGAVRILHGRDSGRMGDLRHICEEINSNSLMRLWAHGLVERR